MNKPCICQIWAGAAQSLCLCLTLRWLQKQAETHPSAPLPETRRYKASLHESRAPSHTHRVHASLCEQLYGRTDGHAHSWAGAHTYIKLYPALGLLHEQAGGESMAAQTGQEHTPTLPLS